MVASVLWRSWRSLARVLVNFVHSVCGKVVPSAIADGQELDAIGVVGCGADGARGAGFVCARVHRGLHGCMERFGANCQRGRRH